ncbi:ABC transporter ATP-binding protein [Pedobacter puniceum]|jgi:Cu-processing system ATP-binding protein|uniref:ATP-binding cassette domain-containing protein n=1 Tax=Pedobacter puniceum TaxID=2666136 RepID=A0A7K0FR23_9SPHI|nr:MULTISPECIES: ABC transporter ATP-binding protein [Pedobacter]KHJ39546.1 arginine transport ATP-binding protein ArtM [Pedobacter glucosidilyticus]MRX48449.1 ATP-binding cassette domain-containing protein [Pedobacter puniceum]
MEELIKISNLKKSFGKLNVLKGLNCSFNGGRVVSILGPNASGKTTLIKSILGMVIPDSGEIFFKGSPVVNTYQYKENIGYMPQIGRYPDHMQIGQLLKMMQDIRKKHSGLDESLIAAFQLQSMFNKAMHTLSGGTRQKVSAALACLFNPDVLILDEPTAGLDPLAAEILKEKIQEQKAKGKLILITSHIMSEVDEIADEVMYLFEGQVKFFMPLSQIKSSTGEEKLGKALTKILAS